MQYDEVKDSGERQEFNTGSRRDTCVGKGRYDLISPVALRRLARHFVRNEGWRVSPVARDVENHSKSRL